ncbi:pyrin-like [Cervus elaphus]|uniref:pyrin-like n=1 Tax=Cervus elaphus TaxID=9860 RepID=UPI001CC2B29C|nr:pyrin-like [Cervus elaphus]
MHRMESTLKACLLHILEDLLEEELVKFKFQLTNITLAEGYNHIPRGTIQQTIPVRLAELLIQYYGEEYSKTVTQEVLKAINQGNLAESLCQATEKCGSSTEKVAKKTNKRKQEDKAGLNEDKWQLTMSKVGNLSWGRDFCPEIEWSVWTKGCSESQRFAGFQILQHGMVVPCQHQMSPRCFAEKKDPGEIWL